MAYLDVDTAARTVRADGDRRGKIEVAFLKRATTRLGAITSTDDQREYRVALSVVDGQMPATWVTVVLGLLDVAGQLSTPTDAQIDAQVVTAWDRLAKAR